MLQFRIKSQARRGLGPVAPGEAQRNPWAQKSLDLAQKSEALSLENGSCEPIRTDETSLHYGRSCFQARTGAVRPEGAVLAMSNLIRRKGIEAIIGKRQLSVRGEEL